MVFFWAFWAARDKCCVPRTSNNRGASTIRNSHDLGSPSLKLSEYIEENDKEGKVPSNYLDFEPIAPDESDIAEELDLLGTYIDF